VATRSQILRLKCTKFYFGCGSAADPTGGAYSAPPNPLAGFKGLLLRSGREWKGREEKRRGKKGKEGDGGGEKGAEGETERKCKSSPTTCE